MLLENGAKINAQVRKPQYSLLQTRGFLVARVCEGYQRENGTAHRHVRGILGGMRSRIAPFPQLPRTARPSALESSQACLACQAAAVLLTHGADCNVCDEEGRRTRLVSAAPAVAPACILPVTTCRYVSWLHVRCMDRAVLCITGYT